MSTFIIYTPVKGREVKESLETLPLCHPPQESSGSLFFLKELKLYSTAE